MVKYPYFITYLINKFDHIFLLTARLKNAILYTSPVDAGFCRYRDALWLKISISIIYFSKIDFRGLT
ncbi:MAG: hypothetical protein A3A96_00090 [Candidatus Zambryskibacteria bacterium RIFCSPLOWO2_01_FULL_39_39]|uniref:Uncharacterized protein n=1 Tax=Candidatus Zambryskibacteria bacterium RIFCSPLOWO2_01_FULL_39_39 TaxID=1802758 RepID=A0A1G2TX10_9BACT|nr:MAG: hypothetical protein A2644_02855 [Candidatus Zambryskibacteria bacterium RIFCSPHIGHO2_01_FULL_39_63]OHB01827.1 MAG: hypothetical protein A3A96_00090 [Candidatus Zambryskibacteria bacterium RIFCSPLOWO2_01_FULL_39_39]